MRAALVAGVALALGSSAWAQPEAPPVNFTIAFIGDQGLGPDSQAVLGLIRAEGADAVLHSGDFDYQDSPAAWDARSPPSWGRTFPTSPRSGITTRARFTGRAATRPTSPPG